MLRVIERVGKPILEAEFGGTDFRLVHTFSCEVDPRKRMFIRDMVAPPVLFGNVTSILQNAALDYADSSEGRSRRIMPFPWPSDGHVFGFPCKEPRDRSISPPLPLVRRRMVMVRRMRRRRRRGGRSSGIEKEEDEEG